MLKDYRSARALGLRRRTALYQAFVPLRVQVAIHVLRGRPTIYGWEFVAPLAIVQSNAMVAKCVLTVTPEVTRG